MSGTADRVTETLILAPEFDAQAYVRLTALLQDMGAQCIRQWSGVGGSQDYFFRRISIGGGFSGCCRKRDIPRAKHHY